MLPEVVDQRRGHGRQPVDPGWILKAVSSHSRCEMSVPREVLMEAAALVHVTNERVLEKLVENLRAGHATDLDAIAFGALLRRWQDDECPQRHVGALNQMLAQTEHALVRARDDTHTATRVAEDR